MNIELLKLLSRNARRSDEDLATMLGITADQVRTEIKEMEKKGYICGYKAVIDWDKLDDASVSAIVDLNVVPKAGFGFEDVAAKISSFSQVEAVYLMSGVPPSAELRGRGKGTYRPKRTHLRSLRSLRCP